MNSNTTNSINETENYDCQSNCKKLCTGIPLFIKTIILITTILCGLNYLFPFISFYLSNVPYYTIYNFQVWRLFSTSLITTNIINIIFSILFWVKHASNLEDTMGTIKYFFIFSLNSTIIQIIFTSMFYVISLIMKKKEFLKSKIDSKGKIDNSGIWPYIICELTLLSLSNPNYPVKFLFFPEFKAKFYPILVLIIFCILNSFTIDLEVLSGIIYAFIFHCFLKKKLRISNNLVRKIENFGFIKCFKIFGGFTSVNKNKFSSNINKINRKVRNVVNNNNNIKGFVPFHGERNVVGDILRESTDQNNPVSNPQSQNETLDVKIQ